MNASLAGAEIVVWNEGASLVLPEREEEIIERGRELAKEQGIDLVMAYIVLLSEDPFQYDNKYNPLVHPIFSGLYYFHQNLLSNSRSL